MTDSISTVVGIHELKNGRTYKVQKCSTPYTGGDYATGGYHITAWEKSMNGGEGGWTYIDNAPDEECVRNFLKAAERLEHADNIAKRYNW